MEVLETRIESGQDGLFHYGKFYFSQIKKGQGITLANSLRRVLLYDLVGFGITHARFQGINQNVLRINQLESKTEQATFHEFSSIPGMRESVFEFLLNLRSIVWRDPFQESRKTKVFVFSMHELKRQYDVQGSNVFILRAKHLKQNIAQENNDSGLSFPEIVNPDQYLATIILSHCPEFEIHYKLGADSEFSTNSNFTGIHQPKFMVSDTKSGSWLPTEGNFFPVKRVNYSIEENSDFTESVFLEIWTNGAVEPKTALVNGFNILIQLFQEAKIG